MSHMECVYATFSSKCAAQKDHESYGMCLLKRGEKTYVFAVTFEIESTLTNDGVRRIRSDVYLGRARVPVQEGVDVDCRLWDRQLDVIWL